jgi:hypothetical protein
MSPAAKAGVALFQYKRPAEAMISPDARYRWGDRHWFQEAE